MGGMAFMILLCFLLVRYVATMSVWVCFSFCFVLSVGLLVWCVYFVCVRKIEGFLCREVVGWSVRGKRGWLCSLALCRNCFACSERCSAIGRTCVSPCRCCVFVYFVQPVAILIALF